MELEKRLKELSGYDISFELRQGYYHIALVYDKNWNILSPENELIYVQEKNGVYHYIASTDSVKLDDIFNVIETTISYNLDLQKKLTLFKEKTEELQQIFADKDFDTLKTLEFTFAKKKESKKNAKIVSTKTEKKSKVQKKSKLKDKKLKETEPKTNDNVLIENQYEDKDNEEIVIMNNEYIQEIERQ